MQTTTTEEEIAPEVKKLANSFARKKGYGKATEITFSDVNEPEIELGESWNGHYKTKGGDVIRFPSAYSRKGHSNMVYCYAKCHVKIPKIYK